MYVYIYIYCIYIYIYVQDSFRTAAETDAEKKINDVHALSSAWLLLCYDVVVHHHMIMCIIPICYT